jgi:hypothetical protein
MTFSIARISGYTVAMKASEILRFCLLVIFCSGLGATEIFHWVDENGVSHFTQSEPGPEVSRVSILTLEDTAPADYNPEEDRYGVQAQAERMAALREEMAEKRKAKAERRRNAEASKPVVQYQEPYGYGFGRRLYPSYYPGPPVRPQPPVAVPYLPDPLWLGSSRN